MNSFHQYTPTEIVFGKETEGQVGALVKKWGGKKVLLHYGKGSVIRSGLLGRVEESLQKEGIEYVKLGGVQPNPLLSLVYEGIELGRKENVDFILAIGGGSAIDSGKAIAIGLANPDRDVWDFYMGKCPLTKSTPIGCVLTMAATGTEMSTSSVVTKDEGLVKRGCNADPNRPAFAILNPELTFTLPKYQIGCGVADIFMHTLERYFAVGLGNDITDRIAEQLLLDLICYGPVQVEKPDDYKAASEIMWCGSLSHNGLTQLGNGATDWATHWLGMEISALFGSAHGATLTAVWGSWARYVYKENVDRFVQYAVQVWDVRMDTSDPERVALEGIRKTEMFFKTLGMPIGIVELLGRPVTDAEIERMVDTMLKGRDHAGNFKKLYKDDAVKIFQAANH